MFKGVLAVAGLILAFFMAAHLATSGDALLKYLETHPESRISLRIPLYIGHGYYCMREYGAAQRYFGFVAQRTEGSSMGQEARIYELHSRRFAESRSLAQMAPAYKAFVERYPNSRYADMARKLIEEAFKRGDS
jgi:TolA-binding protein